MVLFAAIYIYFLIQMVMSSKGKDSLIFEEMKNKLNMVPSIVGKGTKSVKSKISDESVIVIERAKDLTQKAGETIKEGKDYVVSKYKDLKTKLNNTKTKSKKTTKSEDTTIDEKSVRELVKANKELIDLTKKLIEKYEESLKLLEQINKNLSKKK